MVIKKTVETGSSYYKQTLSSVLMIGIDDAHKFSTIDIGSMGRRFIDKNISSTSPLGQNVLTKIASTGIFNFIYIKRKLVLCVCRRRGFQQDPIREEALCLMMKIKFSITGCFEHDNVLDVLLVL